MSTTVALSLGLVVVKAGCAGAPATPAEPLPEIDINVELDVMTDCAAAVIAESGQGVATRVDAMRWVAGDWMPLGSGRGRVTARVFAHPSFGAGITFRVQREAWAGEGSADFDDVAAVGADGSGWDALPSEPGDAQREADLIDATRRCWLDRR